MRSVPEYPKLYQSDNDSQFILEKVKTLRSRLEYLCSLRKLKVIAFSSSIAGEGKTTLCANLAVQFAQAGKKRVLLIDVDMRKSDISRIMNISPEPGLSDFLMRKTSPEKIIKKTNISGLYVIPGGTKVGDNDLLAGEIFGTFLNELKGNFDVIFLDTPPILPVADTLTIRNLIDGLILVFRAKMTPYTMLEKAIEEMGETNILGVVLNGVELEKEQYYKKYYGSYYMTETNMSGTVK